MTFSEYDDHDGLGLAALVRSGAVSASEVVAAAIERIERLNPVLNAVTYTAFEDALAAAKQPGNGPFAGVPMLIKDLGLEVAGWPRTSGSRFCRDVVDRRDSGLVTRYRASGAIPLGRSASSEFGIAGNTETAAYGPTRSPWDTDHIVGGSSGGSGAAVAARIVPVAHASDGLGSIRIPAACCGLVGMKPTRDRVPNLPDGTDYAMGFVCDHVVTRTVRDSAAMLDATGWPEPASPYAPPPKSGPYLDEVPRSPGRLRIRWSSETPRGTPIDPEVQAVLEATADTLARLGHAVEAGGLGVDARALARARAPVSGANFAAAMARTIAEVGRQPGPGDFEPLTLASLNASRQVSGEMAFYGLQELRMLTREVLQRFETFDVFLCPVMTTPPPRIGEISPATMDAAEVNKRQVALYPYTPVFNFTGQPSMSLPLGASAGGLPIGMMLTARYGDEATLFRLAGQLEKEMPWSARRPQLRH